MANREFPSAREGSLGDAMIAGWFHKHDAKKIRSLSAGEVEQYLLGWFECDASVYDTTTDLANAMSEKMSLVEWFGTSIVEYDYNAARIYYDQLIANNTDYIAAAQEELRLAAEDGFVTQHVSI